MSKPCLIRLFVPALTAFLLPFGAFAQTSWLIADLSSRKAVSRVHEDGRVERILTPHRNTDGAGQILISPKRQLIAYTENQNLWLFDSTNKAARQITKVGKPATKKWSAVEVIIHLWSKDEQKLLYEIVGEDAEDPEGEASPTKARPEKYGFYIFDRTTQRHQSIAFPGEELRPIGWLSNGDFLLENGVSNGAMRYSLGNRKLTRIGPEDLPLGQIDLSADETRIAAGIDRSRRMKSSELVSISLSSSATTPITPAGGFTEYQWPRISPDNKRILYIHRTGTSPDRYPINDLVVDTKSLISYTGNARAYWLDSKTIALIVSYERTHELVVIDADSGQTKLRRPWE